MARRTNTGRHAGAFPAVDPTTGREVDVYVTVRKVEQIQSRGRLAVRELAEIVPEVLAQPSCIFEGMRRDADDDTETDGRYCYAKVPSRSFRYRGRDDPTPYEAPPYDGEIFLVFVNSERIAYNWRWEPADGDDPEMPAEHETRFSQQVM